jgi:hypothetical protein
MRVDADHEIHFVCEHLSYLHDDGGNAGAGQAKGSRLRQCCEESRPKGGQASDQASERGARPVPACSPGQLNAKTLPKEVSKDLESRASTVGDQPGDRP